MRLAFVALLSLLIISFSAKSEAEVGVTDKSIKIGMSMALTGGLANVNGKFRLAGAQVFFDKINSEGGVNGRKIELVALDDGYEPKNTVENTRRFIDQEKVFALFMYFGSPTTKAALPLITTNKIPLVAPATGALFVRNPVIHEVINVRAGFNEEADVIVNYLVNQLKITEIGMLSQDDALGNDGVSAVRKALNDHRLKLGTSAQYKRNTVDIASGVDELTKSKPKAYIFWGTQPAGIAFIKAIRAKGDKTPIFGPTILLSKEFVENLGDAGEHVFVTSTMPDWEDTHFSIGKEYISDMKKAGKEHIYNFFAYDTYFCAAVLVEGLKRAGRNLTRESLINAFEAMRDVDVGGIKISFSPKNHQGMTMVFLGKIEKGKYISAM